jgi:hypothetical protein
VQPSKGTPESTKAAGTAAVVLISWGVVECLLQLAVTLLDKAVGHDDHVLHHVLFLPSAAAVAASGLLLRRSRSRVFLTIGIAAFIADNALGWWLVPTFSKTRAMLFPGLVLVWLVLLWRRVGPSRQVLAK